MDTFQNPVPSTSGSVNELKKILQTWEDRLESVGAEETIGRDILSDRDLLGILQDDIIDDYVMSPSHVIDPTEFFFEDDPLSIAVEQTGWTVGNPSRESQNLFEFRGEPGLKVNLGNNPVDYFRAIMTNTCFETLIRCTNDYGNKLKSHAAGSARAVSWKNVSIEEMETFLGLIFHMGFVKLNRIDDYWKKDILFHQPIFAKKMARNRFQLILRSLNVQTVQSTTSYEKIRWMLDFFNTKMHEIYYPMKNLVIDESMMFWMGKRHKHGLKIYMLMDQIGVACRIHLYGGSADDLIDGTNHVKKVVLHLLSNYKNMGHSLFIDNFYRSVTLSGQLEDIKVYSTGTLNSRRKDIPEELKTAKLKTGEAAIMHKNGLCIVVWKDKREIMALSNKYNAEFIETRNRRGHAKFKPNIIAQYTKHMKSIDYHDQMMAYYSCEHKSLIWYKKVIIHMLEMMMKNAYLLYRENIRHMTLYDFKLSVIKSLLSYGVELCLPLTSRVHLPSNLPKDDRGHTKRRRCSQCWKVAKKRVQSIFFCNDCLEKPGLCLSCFREYHKY